MESEIQFKDSGIPLTIGIQNPGFTNRDWNPVPAIRNPRRGIQNPRVDLVKRQFFCLSFSYALMTDCWKQNPDERPSFKELVEMLENLMLQDVEYFDFNLLDETKDYYQFQESKTGEVNSDNKSLQEKASSIDLAI